MIIYCDSSTTELCLASDKPQNEVAVIRYPMLLTVNQGEYCALICALAWAKAGKDEPVEIRSDSQLIVNQVNGRYKCRDKTLQYYLAIAQDMLDDLPNVRIVWIPREENIAGHELEKVYAQHNIASRQKHGAERSRVSRNARGQ